METVKISENAIKIMLSRDEKPERLELDGLLTALGIGTGGEGLLIELFSGIDGGCEIFITASDTGEEQTMAVKAGTAEKHARPCKYSVGIFEITELDALIRLCARLSGTLRSAQSAVYAGQTGYFLVLCSAEASEGADFLCSLIDEYGGVRRKSASYAYIKEHCREICASDAIERLARLV